MPIVKNAKAGKAATTAARGMRQGKPKTTQVAAIPHKSATVVARTLFERWILRYCAPESIVSDQGKEFCNKVMYSMCYLWGIKKKRTSPFHPQANRGAESFNCSFRKFFMTTLENTKTLEWEELLPYFVLMYIKAHRIARSF
jgi:transposase InsO family protein